VSLTPRVVDHRYRPPSSWTLLCHPDDPHKTLIREDGALLYGFHAGSFDSWQFNQVFEFRAHTARAPERISQQTESPRRAIVCTTTEYPDQTLRLTTFTHTDGDMRCDVVLWEIDAHTTVLAGLHIDAYTRGEALAAPVGGPDTRLFAVACEPRPRFAAWVDDLPRAEPDPAALPKLISAPQPFIGVHATGFRPATGLVTTPVLLSAGERVRGVVLRPLIGPVPDGIGLDWALQAVKAERRYWDELQTMRLPLSVPDDGIQAMVEACARNILQAREIEDGLPVLHVGPTIYRGLWLVDGHFLLEAARYLGHDTVADDGLEVLLRRVTGSGAVVQMQDEPHTKETAVAIATLVRQTQLSGDLDRLRRQWPAVRAGFAHIQELRRQAAQLPDTHPFFDLMPEAFGDGGIGGTRSEYTTIFWTLIGLSYAVQGAGLLGEVDDQERFRHEFTGLRDAFARSAARHRVAASGAHHLPMGPGSGRHQFQVDAQTVPPWREIQPETATWAFCHAIWPGEVFDPADPWVRDLLELLDRRDDEQGIPATTGWLPFHGVWTYSASFAAHAWLWAGRPDKTVDYLYAFVNHASPTRVWREEQSTVASGLGQVCGDMPHNWASAELIRLVRHLLVFERGEDLHLLAGVPEQWLTDGKRIHVTSTPTRYGRVTVDVQAHRRRLTVAVTVEPGVDKPAAIVLRVPPQLYRAVQVEGEATYLTDADGCVRLPYTTGETMMLDVH